MSNDETIWLVEIRVKDWVFIPKHKPRVFDYEEVAAGDEISARLAGFEQFKRRIQYETAMKMKFQKAALEIQVEIQDFCAPDAVQI